MPSTRRVTLGADKRRENVIVNNDLHLSVSMRSFRSEKVSALVKDILDLEIAGAKANLREVVRRYPIVLTAISQRRKIG